MNVALIFAGGTGQRMNSKSIPKQFLELHGKPIIIYTLEHFEFHPEIDSIVIVCIKSWIDHLYTLIKKYNFKKNITIISGGETGQLSIFNGLLEIEKKKYNNPIVLIHDGVRPLINAKLISENILSVKKYRSAITVSDAIETIALIDHEKDLISNTLERDVCKLAKAPQSFYLNDILKVHLKMLKLNQTNITDSATMMNNSGYKLHLVQSEPINIKITTPIDFYMFKAILDSKESEQIYGAQIE